MKNLLIIIALLVAANVNAQNSSAKKTTSGKKLFIDVHQLEPGKVKFDDVAEAHKKDLAVQSKYDVSFIKYWVDEKNGLVYCLSSANDTNDIRKAHAEAHGLIPAKVYEVTPGQESAGISPDNLVLDIHYLGENKVTAADVSEAHKKDLSVEDKHDVKFINYWVDEKDGVVFCLSQANNKDDVTKTHAEAHGLIPASVESVKEGK
jgi:hypothetical protein